MRDFKSIERETPGRDQVNQLHTPSETGIPNQKSITSIRGERNSNPSSILNETEPNQRRR